MINGKFDDPVQNAKTSNLDAPQAKNIRPDLSENSRSEEEHLDLFDHFQKVSEKNSQKVENLLMKCNTESNDIICRLRESMDNNAKMHENHISRLEQEKKDLECTVTELKNNIIELKRKASDAQGKQICCGCNGIVDFVFFCTTQCLENHTK